MLNRFESFPIRHFSTWLPYSATPEPYLDSFFPLLSIPSGSFFLSSSIPRYEFSNDYPSYLAHLQPLPRLQINHKNGPTTEATAGRRRQRAPAPPDHGPDRRATEHILRCGAGADALHDARRRHAVRPGPGLRVGGPARRHHAGVADGVRVVVLRRSSVRVPFSFSTPPPNTFKL